jgi:hypothetical protein
MMKSVLAFAVALVLLLPSLAEAQIPNPGFETWSNGVPGSWNVNNIPTFATPITQTSTAHTGSSALKGAVVSFMNIVSYPPEVWTEFPVSQRFATFSGWYTYNAVGGDSMYGYVLMMKSGVGIGVSVFGNKTTRASYTQFSTNIDYVTGDVPDSCEIWFAIAGTTANGDTIHVGSNFTIDDLSLSGTATGVEEQASHPLSYSLGQNFPNPFNPSTIIQYQLANAGPVRLTVYDILGRQVATLVDGIQTQGTHEVRFDAGGLASGVYLYRIQTLGFVQQKKMVLQK